MKTGSENRGKRNQEGINSDRIWSRCDREVRLWCIQPRRRTTATTMWKSSYSTPSLASTHLRRKGSIVQAENGTYTHGIARISCQDKLTRSLSEPDCAMVASNEVRSLLSSLASSFPPSRFCAIDALVSALLRTQISARRPPSITNPSDSYAED